MPEVPAYTAAEVKAAETPLLAAGEPLMARAAAALARIVRDELPRDDASGGTARILVLVGGGDNGGDALFAAADLAGDGHHVDLALVGRRAHEEGLAAALAAGARIVDAVAATDPCDVIVDGVLGIGTQGDPVLRGVVRDIVAAQLPAVRDGATRVVAVDLPSGLHPDSGTTADGLVLPAAVTATFGAVKAGLVRGEGPALAGRVILVDIGLGPHLADAVPQAVASVWRIDAG